MTVVEVELCAHGEVTRVRPFDRSGNRRLAVIGDSQLGRLDKQRQRQQMGCNRQRVDTGIEDAQAARLPDPRLTGVPFAYVFLPVDLHAVQGAGSQPRTGGFDTGRIA
ncbi:hypothetical protein PS862_05889 [Pseudomonas fluorescens]|uniref:Uncharacterized protein n=1 Tax=Pseudomonas fluorescens TaxID=294 RepID=A0A5E7QGR6_PSEFL|nr:hypothetical protein PS862_05889 [Pseudomonas fluorescens]